MIIIIVIVTVVVLLLLLLLLLLIIFIIVILFVISPLSNFFKTSFLMKLIALALLGYSIYLNIFQTNMLSNQNNPLLENPQLSSQINNNIICSYIFTVFLTLLFIFILKDLLFLWFEQFKWFSKRCLNFVYFLIKYFIILTIIFIQNNQGTIC